MVLQAESRASQVLAEMEMLAEMPLPEPEPESDPGPEPEPESQVEVQTILDNTGPGSLPDRDWSPCANGNLVDRDGVLGLPSWAVFYIIYVFLRIRIDNI